MLTNGDIVLRVLSSNLIPWTFTLIAPFRDLFSPIFIRDKKLLSAYKQHVTYFIVGQSFLIGPLGALMCILDFFVYGKEFGGLALFGVSVYLLVWVLLLTIYLCMGADIYDAQILAVKWFYAMMPAIVMTLSIILCVVSELSA